VAELAVEGEQKHEEIDREMY
jgi:hypothetical protein